MGIVIDWEFWIMCGFNIVWLGMSCCVRVVLCVCGVECCVGVVVLFVDGSWEDIMGRSYSKRMGGIVIWGE